MATSAPSSANISATPLPIPWLAPVMSATLLRSFMFTPLDWHSVALHHRPPGPLVDRPATIDHQHVANDHIGEGAGEKQHCTHQVLGLIPSSPRNHLLGSPFFVAWPFQNVFA